MNDRIIKALSGFYYVQTPDGVVECRARGRFRKEGVSPLVGDFVRISRSGKSGTVEEILPRKNSFIRPAVANVDLLVCWHPARFRRQSRFSSTACWRLPGSRGSSRSSA